jgi:dTDP-4-amino-4,6-dideoxygalactose transaminase
MDDILNIAKKNNLFVIEDTAQTLGAEYFFSNGSKSKAGTIGDIGTASFFPSKNLGAYGD